MLPPFSTVPDGSIPLAPLQSAAVSFTGFPSEPDYTAMRWLGAFACNGGRFARGGGVAVYLARGAVPGGGVAVYRVVVFSSPFKAIGYPAKIIEYHVHVIEYLAEVIQYKDAVIEYEAGVIEYRDAVIN